MFHRRLNLHHMLCLVSASFQTISMYICVCLMWNNVSFGLETPPCSAKSLKKGFRERSKKGRFEVILEMGGHWEVVLSIPQHLGVRA